MQITFTESDHTDLSAQLHDKWLKSLTAPQDGMWEAFINMGTAWQVLFDGNIVGYASVGQDGRLLQFYIEPEHSEHGPYALESFIGKTNVSTAMVGTNNPLMLALCMHFQKNVSIDTYFFTEVVPTRLTFDFNELVPAISDDLNRIVEFCHESVGAPKEWLNGYIGGLITRNEIHILQNDLEIMGSCEVRKSDTQESIADLGMIVSPRHRKKGVGSYLLQQALSKALNQGLKPICSCEKDNLGSLKSIHRNGFRSIHCLLNIGF